MKLCICLQLKNKSPTPRDTYLIRYYCNQVTHSTCCPPKTFPFCPPALQKILIFAMWLLSLYPALPTLWHTDEKGIHVLKQPWTIILLNKGVLMVVMYLLVLYINKQVQPLPYLIWGIFFPFNLGVTLDIHRQEWTICAALCPEN